MDYDVVNGWIKEAADAWKEMVPLSYVGAITECDMDEVWRLMMVKGMTYDQFQEWLDQRAWDNAQEALSSDMAALELVKETDDGTPGESWNVEQCNQDWEDFRLAEAEREKERAREQEEMLHEAIGLRREVQYRKVPQAELQERLRQARLEMEGENGTLSDGELEEYDADAEWDVLTKEVKEEILMEDFPEDYAEGGPSSRFA